MYIEGENPAMSDPDLNHAREALAKLEHLVVQDLFLTETAFHADVVLPASAFAEKAGTFTNTDRRVQIARPVVRAARRRAAGLVDHPGDRPPHRARTGTTTGRGDDLRRDGAGDAVAATTSPGSALEREGAVTYPVDAPDEPGNEIIFAAGLPDRRAGAAASSRPPSRRPTRSPTTTIRWCFRPAASWSTGIPAP